MGGNLVSLGLLLIIAGVGGFVWYYLDLFGERLPSDNERAGRVTCYALAGLGAALIVIGVMIEAR